ncbi:hypothetical protein TNCV_5011701 [Trichonephila clavipes]|nr:hypothetical protein TNCV_5011701 [Trichonephila clavipes]
MLPGSSTSLTALFHGCGSHLKLLECVVDGTGGGRVRYGDCRRQIYRPISKKEEAHHSSAGGKSVSCCLRKADLPENCCQTFEGGGGTTHADLLCVSHSPDSTVLPVCNGVMCITIGLNRTGHAYYSQMRVGSVCHRIVDAN